MRCGQAIRAACEEAAKLAASVRSFGGEVVGAALDTCFVGAPLKMDLLLTDTRAELAFTSDHDGEPMRAAAQAVLGAWRSKSSLQATLVTLPLSRAG